MKLEGKNVLITGASSGIGQAIAGFLVDRFGGRRALIAGTAQLGPMSRKMKNEEIDALKTLGISPMEFLVLPRMIALIVMKINTNWVVSNFCLYNVHSIIGIVYFVINCKLW